MEQIIRFFLSKSRLNYTLLFFLIILGVVSYQTIPKDVFPPIKIKKIVVNGYYAGASVDTLNKMAVTNLEKDLKSISGVEKIESFIKNSQFDIILTLEESSNQEEILNKAKDEIANNKTDLPEDMDEPVASILEWSFPLMNITVSSSTADKNRLIQVANEIKNKISSIPNISKVELYEDTTRVFEFILDNEKIELYGLNKNLLFEEIRNISYIYPLGKIENKNEHLYLSTINGKKEIEEYLNTLIKVADKTIYLSDIAKVEQKYKKTDVISKLNGKFNVQILTAKNDKANAIQLVEELKSEVAKLNKQYKDIDIDTFYDTSIYIKERLNTVISGIMFGLVLVATALYILINKRVAFIVAMGIPTAILLGVVVLSFTPYTINMVTLIGALLIIGMLVDGAVIISENIQRHIVQGDDKFEAAISGTKEVMLPVIASSFTTVFAFLPMMMLTNELGQFLIMIPVAVIVLIVASLVESFIFLPIHSLHFLNKNDKELDWSKAQNFYEKILSKVVAYRKTFLASFMIIIPIVTVLIISNMKFQIFPDFDGNRFFIEGEFDVNQNVKETYEKTKIIENVLLEQKDILGIKSISFTSGYKETEEESIMKPSLFQFNVELHKKIPDNFVDEYITPFLSFENDDTPCIREYTVNEILEKLNISLKDYNPKGIKSFVIKKESSGVTAHDIEILLSTENKKILLEAVKKIEDKLLTIDGVYSIENTAQFGIKELKLKLNSYGESLGFNETLIASNISSLYLEAKHSKGFDKEGIFEILTYSLNKDNFEFFENIELSIPNSEQKIALRNICDFTYVQNFDSIKKVNKQDVKMVTANVHTKKITALEVLEQLKPIFQEYKEQGVMISLEGEQEQNERMKKEMSYAFFIAVFLMFITLLIMFDSFKYTFMILSIIPFSVLGGIIGHLIMGLNLSLTSIIGILGLAGVVINNAIVMIDFMKNSTTIQEVIESAKLRLRPIIITSVTTFLGLTTLMFYATGQAKILQPIAISLGFGLIWGTVLTLLYIPILFIISKKFTKGETI